MTQTKSARCFYLICLAALARLLGLPRHSLARADERTGLPALFVYCHSAKDGCKGAGQRMLSFLDADEAAEAAEVLVDAGIEPATTSPAQPGLGQAAVAIGECQKALDRLLENPGGGWATVESLGVIACALCTAAGGHDTLRATARRMLDGVLDATPLEEAERDLAKRAFQPARVPLDPVATRCGPAKNRWVFRFREIGFGKLPTRVWQTWRSAGHRERRDAGRREDRRDGAPPGGAR